MTRAEFASFMREEFERLVRLFESKNNSYGADEDVFYNFRESARRIFNGTEKADLFQVLLVLADKHIIALERNNIYDPEAESRLRDIILYALLGLGILKGDAR